MTMIHCTNTLKAFGYLSALLYFPAFVLKACLLNNSNPHVYMDDYSTFKSGKQATGVAVEPLPKLCNSADEVILHHCKNK